MPAPAPGGEPKSCGGACCRSSGERVFAREVVNGLTAASEKIPSSSAPALDERGDGGQKGAHIVGSGKDGERFPFRSIFGALVP